MNNVPSVYEVRPEPNVRLNHDSLIEQLARTRSLIEASSDLRTTATSLRGEADQLRAHARVIRNR